jgi:hypothetical protein
MPIFLGHGQRIYFAHVPKAAGTSVYVLFLRNGWRVANVDTRPRRGIGRILARDFGVTDIPFEGGREGLDCTAQHAPAEVWTRWGPFDAAFALVRDPAARYLSAVRWRYALVPRRPEPLTEFRLAVLARLERELHRKPGLFDGHFRPQTAFLAPGTEAFRIEDGWQERLAARFGLDPGAPIVENRSRADGAAELTPAEADFVRRTYAGDFARLGYAPPA